MNEGCARDGLRGLTRSPGVPGNMLTRAGAGYLIDKLQDALAQRQERAGA